MGSWLDELGKRLLCLCRSGRGERQGTRPLVPKLLILDRPLPFKLFTSDSLLATSRLVHL